MSPPDQFAEPTDGTSGDGSPAGSTMTNGMARERSCSRYSGARSEKTSTTPTGRRRSTPSIQSGSGAWRLPLTVSTTLRPCSFATSSTPSMISIDQLRLELVEDQLDEARLRVGAALRRR